MYQSLQIEFCRHLLHCSTHYDVRGWQKKWSSIPFEPEETFANQCLYEWPSISWCKSILLISWLQSWPLANNGKDKWLLLNHDDRSAGPMSQELFLSIIMARDLGRHVSFQVKTAFPEWVNLSLGNISFINLWNDVHKMWNPLHASYTSIIFIVTSAILWGVSPTLIRILGLYTAILQMLLHTCNHSVVAHHYCNGLWNSWGTM